MKLLSTKNLIIKLTDTKLQIIDLPTLKEKHAIRKPTPQSIALFTPTILLYGQYDGTLVHFCLKAYTPTKLHTSSTKNNALCALATLDDFIYAGYSDGTLIKFKYKSSKLSVFKTYSHNLPILDIISNGEQILVSDLSGKVTSYPSLVVYDLVEPLFVFKFYIFIAEKSILYCLTRNSLSSYLQLDSYIKKYTFSRNGGVLFVMSYDRIIVYDFNNKQVIKEIQKSFIDFIYDEDRNRLIGFYDKSKEIVNNVLDDVYDEMINIVFEENKIQEKIVKINEDEEYNYNGDEYYTDEDDYYEDEYISDESDEIKRLKGSETKRLKGSEKKRSNVSTNLKNLFDDKNLEKRIKIRKKKVIDSSSSEEEISIVHNSVFPINDSQDCSLLFYNDIGYLVSIKGPEFNKVELIFHDKSKQNIELSDYNDCTIGTFYNKNILLCNTSTAFFYGKNKWTKDLSNNDAVVACTDNYVLISNGLTIVYDCDGKEIFNFYITNISYILTSSKYIFVFADKLTVIELFTSTEEYTLPCKVTWATCYNDKLYYKINNDIYTLYNKLTYLLFKDIKYPLTVIGNRLVYLNTNSKILPSPNVEFKDINFPLDVYKENIQNNTKSSVNIKKFEVDSFSSEGEW